MTAVIAYLPRGRRGVSIEERDKRRAVVGILPKGYGAYGFDWLYAVGFTSGLTKLGKTGKPRDRIVGYWRQSHAGIAWIHLFSRHPEREASDIERRALQLAKKVSVLAGGGEWFNHLSKADALVCMRQAIHELGHKTIPRDKSQSRRSIIAANFKAAQSSPIPPLCAVSDARSRN